jgi:hypothetical protein
VISTLHTISFGVSVTAAQSTPSHVIVSLCLIPLSYSRLATVSTVAASTAASVASRGSGSWTLVFPACADTTKPESTSTTGDHTQRTHTTILAGEKAGAERAVAALLLLLLLLLLLAYHAVP